MNKYGRLAQTHWSRWLPTRYAQIPDPESFFTDLGEQIQEQVSSTADAISSQQPPQTQYLARVGQLNMARLVAEEQVMGEMAYLTPEPGIEGDQETSEGLPNQPSLVMDAQGMPTDLDHPLWEAEHDPEISPEQYRAMLRAFHQQIRTQQN